MHLAQPRILQAFSAAYYRIGVRRAAEEVFHHAFVCAHQHIVGIHVFLFIHGFEFALKQAEHRTDKALTVERRPLVYILRQERVVIYGIVEARCGVKPRTSVARHKIAELVGYGILGSLCPKPVYVGLYLPARCLISGLRQQVVFG